MRQLVPVLIAASLSLPCALAHADRVYLMSGAVIEGQASRVGEKVIVELPSGRVTLSAASVKKVEQAPTEMQRVDQRYAQLAPNDVQGLLALANHCREHGMREREEQLLKQVISVSPDHPEARARLGYVRADSGWVKREEQLLAQGYVKRSGRWLTPEQLLALEKAEAETRAAQLKREQASLELEARRADIEAKHAEQAHLERVRARELRTPAAPRESDGMAAYYGPYNGLVPFYPPGLPNPTPPPGPSPAPAPIPGFRDPSNMSFQVPGYRDPRSYF
jgi:hypothetical protein